MLYVQAFVIMTRDDCVDPFEAQLYPIADGMGASLSIVIQPDRPGDATRTWGTGHAVLSAQTAIDGPFAVANGDDWYGPTAHQTVADALTSDNSSADVHFLITYPIANTLTDTDRVSRACCKIAHDGSLSGIQELLNVHVADEHITGFSEDGVRQDILPNTPVSTNLWGFQPSIFEHMENQFRQFSRSPLAREEHEFALPLLIHRLLKNDSIRVDTLPTEERMFGLTRAEDLPRVRTRIDGLVASGVYPADLRSGHGPLTTPEQGPRCN